MVPYAVYGWWGVGVLDVPGLRGVLHFLFPAPCLGCGALGREGTGPLGLCARCEGRVLPSCPAGMQPCHSCGRPLAAAEAPAGYVCGQCRQKAPTFESLVTLWRYRPPLSEVLLALKARRLEYLGTGLAAAALERLQRTDAAEPLFTLDLAVPVPLHWRRRWVRGFNQVESFARPLAAGLGVQFCDALVRRRGGRAQRFRGRGQRLTALQGSYAVRRGVTLEGLRVLLVDDVVTTGATLEAAATALRQGGVREIVALALARTPAAEGIEMAGM